MQFYEMISGLSNHPDFVGHSPDFAWKSRIPTNDTQTSTPNRVYLT